MCVLRGSQCAFFIYFNEINGQNFDNALVNINEFCVFIWWLMYNVNQPLKIKYF